MVAVTEAKAVDNVWFDKTLEHSGLLGCDRAHERYEWNHWVHVSWVQNSMIGEPVVVGTADLSAGGIGMICPNMIHPGSIGLVMFLGADRQLKLHYVQVVHCRYLIGSMAHLVGAKWIGEPAGLPEVKAEMTPDGPKLSVGLLRSRRDVCRLRRPPTFAAQGGFAGPGERR